VKEGTQSSPSFAYQPRERIVASIFQVSSVGARHGVPGNTPYHAAKWAVGGFSDSLAMEVAPFGVKVCTLEPGGIRTNWARRAVQSKNAWHREAAQPATVDGFHCFARFV
jgi:NAD(P)-dependent dehydrogenase (short-subunit alcohol dehydrogenase family)